MVATLRICGDAASRQDWARAGWLFLIAGSAATWARVAIGPMRTLPSGAAAIFASPGIDLRSTTRGGSTRRSFRWSSRSMPPALSTAPGFSETSSRAWATLVARAYSKAFISAPPRFGQGGEDPVGGDGQGTHAGAGRVEHGVGHRAQRGDDARLSDPGRRRVVPRVGDLGDDGHRLEHVLRQENLVGLEVGVDHRADVAVQHAVLEERPRHALDHRADDLALGREHVDGEAAVVDGDDLEDAHLARLRVHLD